MTEGNHIDSAAIPRRPSRVPRLSGLVVVIAVIGGLIAAALATASVLRQPARFESRTVLIIDQPSLIAGAGGEGVVSKLNSLRAKYGVLARTRLISQPVSKKIGIPEGLIVGSLNISLPGPSLVTIVSSRTGDPEVSRKIADGVALEIVERVKSEMEAAKIPAANRIVMSVVAPAQRGFKIEPTRNRALTVGALTGALTLVGVYLLGGEIRARRAR